MAGEEVALTTGAMNQVLLIAIGAAITSLIGFIAKNLSMVGSLQRDLMHIQKENEHLVKKLDDNTNLTVQMGKVLSETAPTLTGLTKLTDMYVPKVNSLEKSVVMLREKIIAIEQRQQSAVSNSRSPVRAPQRRQQPPQQQAPEIWSDDGSGEI
jgi:hypothetical protein